MNTNTPDTLFTRTPDELDALLGYYLRQRRLELGINLQVISQALQLTEDTVTVYECGNLIIPEQLLNRWILLVHLQE